MVRRVLFPVSAFMFLLYIGCMHYQKDGKPIAKEIKDAARAGQAYNFDRTTDCDYNETIDGVTLQVRAISGQESKELFGRNVIKKGLQPLQIFLYNNTPYNQVWRPSYIDLPLSSSREISKRVKRDTALWVAAIWIPIYVYVAPVLTIYGAPLTALYLSKQNKKRGKKVEANALNHTPMHIPPYERVSKFIFIPREEYKKDFEIRLFNEDKKKLITFEVDC